MNGVVTENNVVNITGVVSGEPKFSHEVYGESFYTFFVNVPRLSKKDDKIPVMISERLVEIAQLVPGIQVAVQGQFRSHNNTEQGRNRLVLTVFARELQMIDGELDIPNSNTIFLNGFICKKPIYRMTPFGREICDLLLAVNRAYYKSDYIPCICWGRNARFSENLIQGDNIKIWGRVQSRVYQKKHEDGQVSENMAYEVSVARMEIGKDKEMGEVVDTPMPREMHSSMAQYGE